MYLGENRMEERSGETKDFAIMRTKVSGSSLRVAQRGKMGF
jgi:hypothetical protein